MCEGDVIARKKEMESNTKIYRLDTSTSLEKGKGKRTKYGTHESSRAVRRLDWIKLLDSRYKMKGLS